MPTINSAWVYVDLSPKIAVANTNEIIAKPAGVAGTIKQIWIGINTVLTTGGGIVAVAKGSTNVLSSPTYNLGAAATPDLVAATPELATLAANANSLKVAATDWLKATWTLTTAAITNAAACIVVVEPDYW